jgi:hypothetical protein
MIPVPMLQHNKWNRAVVILDNPGSVRDIRYSDGSESWIRHCSRLSDTLCHTVCAMCVTQIAFQVYSVTAAWGVCHNVAARLTVVRDRVGEFIGKRIVLPRNPLEPPLEVDILVRASRGKSNSSLLTCGKDTDLTSGPTYIWARIRFTASSFGQGHLSTARIAVRRVTCPGKVQLHLHAVPPGLFERSSGHGKRVWVSRNLVLKPVLVRWTAAGTAMLRPSAQLREDMGPMRWFARRVGRGAGFAPKSRPPWCSRLPASFVDSSPQARFHAHCD